VKAVADNEPTLHDPTWWKDPWWEDAVYQQEHSVTLDQIRAPIEALKMFFTEDWTRSALAARPPNAVIPILYGGKGLWPFQNLMQLASIVSPLINLPSVQRPRRDLIGDKSRSALFEMEVGSWFVEQGWDVEFVKPVAQKTPDLRIAKAGITAAVECKHFRAEAWEDWAEALGLSLMQRMTQQGLVDLPSHEILFEPRLSDLSRTDNTAIKAALQEEISELICAAVKQAFSSDPAQSVHIPGVALIRFRPDLPKGQSGMGGMEVSPQGKMMRILANGILEAAEQLRAHGPGSVVISGNFTPPEPLLDVVLRAVNRADPSRLASVAVVVITGSYGSPPVIWKNTLTPRHLTDDLTDTFKAILNTPKRLFVCEKGDLTS
jgi:hypothetical protein